MKVSVITVCRNCANTIEDTLLSIASQSFENSEHIVIDGNSTDGTVDILRKYQHQIAYWCSEPDKGVYDAMNKGIAKATGDIIGFLNADDVYKDNEVLEKVVAAFLSEKCDAVFSDLIYVKQDDLNSVVRKYSSKKFSPNRLAYGWMPAHPTLYFRAEVFKKYGHFKIDYKIAGDYELIARLFYKYKISYHYLPITMVKMRMGGISTQGWKNTILLNKEILRACNENDIQTNLFKIYSKYPQKIIELFQKRDI